MSLLRKKDFSLTLQCSLEDSLSSLQNSPCHRTAPKCHFCNKIWKWAMITFWSSSEALGGLQWVCVTRATLSSKQQQLLIREKPNFCMFASTIMGALSLQSHCHHFTYRASNHFLLVGVAPCPSLGTKVSDRDQTTMQYHSSLGLLKPQLPVWTSDQEVFIQPGTWAEKGNGRRT